MPLFEFQCLDCKAEFELIIHASDTPRCTHCKSIKLKKLISKFKVGGRGDLRESTDHGCHGPVFTPDGKSEHGHDHHGHHHDDHHDHPKPKKKKSKK